MVAASVRNVLLHPLLMDRFRDCHHSPLIIPAQHYLCRTFPIFLPDTGKHFIGKKIFLAFRKRYPRLRLDLILLKYCSAPLLLMLRALAVLHRCCFGSLFFPPVPERCCLPPYFVPCCLAADYCHRRSMQKAACLPHFSIHKTIIFFAALTLNTIPFPIAVYATHSAKMWSNSLLFNIPSFHFLSENRKKQHLRRNAASLFSFSL